MFGVANDFIPVDIPDGVSGNWTVESFEVSETDAEFFNMGNPFAGVYGRGIKPGTYKRLVRTDKVGDDFVKDKVIMSNTPAECRDHREFIQRAKGKVLINGLGLGVALKAILEKDEVEEVTVIEISEDVINLVAPYFEDDPRVTIIHADCLEWKAEKGKRFDVVWHDIWDNISTDNLPTMGKLHRKYGKRCDWQDSWGRYEVKRMQREEYDYRRY